MPYKNIELRRARRRQYYKENRDYILEQNRKWEFPERRRELGRKYYQANKVAILARVRAWTKKNWDKELINIRRRNAKRRAIQRGAAVGANRADYIRFVRAVAKTLRISCYWCGNTVRKADRHIDHIMPLSRGGADDVHNICCSCSHCNHSKGAKSPAEFSGQHQLIFT